MNATPTSKLKAGPLDILKWLAVWVGCGAGAFAVYHYGGPQWAWISLAAVGGIALIFPLFTGFGGVGACPCCQRYFKLGMMDALEAFPCPSCQDYLEAKRGVVRQVDPEKLADNHVFGVALPWDDLHSIVGASFSPLQALTKNQGTRELPANWPDACCVCGGHATRRLGFQSHIQKAAQGASLRDERFVIVVNNIPHCDKHKNGVKLASQNLPGADRKPLRLCFRSNSYRNKFRRLNRWA